MASGPVAALDNVSAWQRGPLRVIRSIDDGLMHLSISRADRYPSWDEIRDTRYELLPDEKTFGLLLPPRAEYVNVHQNCFHLWEIDDRRGADQRGRIVLP